MCAQNITSFKRHAGVLWVWKIKGSETIASVLVYPDNRFGAYTLPASQTDRAASGSASIAKIDALCDIITASLEDDKAEDITVIDLAQKSSLADVMIIASGRSARHVSALADHLARHVKDKTGTSPKLEGLPNADWVLIDLGDIIVHLFRPEVRKFYNLERIWAGDSDDRRSARPH